MEERVIFPLRFCKPCFHCGLSAGLSAPPTRPPLLPQSCRARFAASPQFAPESVVRSWFPPQSCLPRTRAQSASLQPLPSGCSNARRCLFSFSPLPHLKSISAVGRLNPPGGLTDLNTLEKLGRDVYFYFNPLGCCLYMLLSSLYRFYLFFVGRLRVVLKTYLHILCATARFAVQTLFHVRFV